MPSDMARRVLSQTKSAALVLLLAVTVTGVARSDDFGLPASIQSVMNLRQLPDESLSIYAEDVDTGEVLLRWRESESRNPASTIKLLTTLVALDILGPSYRWKTDVHLQGEVDGDRLNGDLLIRGYGDPFLVTERVWQMLRTIRRLGIREISGDLLIDDNYFQVGDYDPAAFDRQPLRAYNVAPNALLMNFKVVRYWFEPDPESDGVKVLLDPSLENLRVHNQLGLASGRCRGYQRGIAITANDAVDEITFSGKFPDGCKRYAMDRTALSHNQFVYGLFATLWRQLGGHFDGGWRNVDASDTLVADAEPLLSFDSLPLNEMIARVNKHSNNVMARQLVYTLSAEVNGPPGTEAGGRDVIA
ncbi:MAG: D-alanyl-D-alanine carboxypeptidase/D-alanyl-D-alanine-endopeptidase, partial [Woeseiaceae bacterium]